MTDSTTSRQIAILGPGKVGRAVGRLWTSAGHTVTFGSRSPGRLTSFIRELGDRARAATLTEAASTGGDIVLLSVPHPALDELLESLGDRLSGKIIIDAANPMGLSPDGRIISTLGPAMTQGRRTAKLLPDSIVIRAFTHVMDELLWSRGTGQAHFWAMAFAGDDAEPKAAEAKTVVASLVHDAGFTPVDLGCLDDSAALDPGGSIFPHMFTAAGLRSAAGLAS
jgi:8-hydroxy-5-deazaflavin:NADPH oxidoreductase